MSDPGRETLAWMRRRSDIVIEVAQSSGTRITVWLVVGNAGALLFAYQAILTGKAPSAVAISAGWFVWGLAFAFSGAALGYLGALLIAIPMDRSINGVATVLQNDFYIERLEERFPDVPLPEDGPLQQQMSKATADLEIAAKQLNWAWLPAGVVMTLMLVSAFAFLMGATAPLRQPIEPPPASAKASPPPTT